MANCTTDGSSGKQTYTSPQLTVYGTLEEITAARPSNAHGHEDAILFHPRMPHGHRHEYKAPPLFS